ncbi:hypothetical protein DRJ25_03730 [Candidatus Woesearchaeota archaeon]|nr:MAG: hypothetical protein DRJ25_03730 [Candidatus Woesearchaeota archaeon]
MILLRLLLLIRMAIMLLQEQIKRLVIMNGVLLSWTRMEILCGIGLRTLPQEIMIIYTLLLLILMGIIFLGGLMRLQEQMIGSGVLLSWIRMVMFCGIGHKILQQARLKSW